MGKRPLLILGDSPTGHSGLGRILRDVAVRIHEHLGDLFDVATLGYGAPPSKSLPFMQYPADLGPDWVVRNLPYAWKDHVGGDEGILLCIWDISRLLWLAFPEHCPDESLKTFLDDFKGKKWIYPAVDGAGPNGKLPYALSLALPRFDRVANYTRFSAAITGYPDVLHHGIDTSVFYRRPNAREWAEKRFALKLDADEKLIGIVATNQPRKDWALAFGAMRYLKHAGIRARLWIHTDTAYRHWDLSALYNDFGLFPEIKVIMTPYGMGDDELAAMYSACDLTLGIGAEGFGYPLAESLCCGTPCVTGSYGGQADFVPLKYQFYSSAFRHEGVFAIERPVYEDKEWGAGIVRHLGCPESAKPVCSWDEVWPQWQMWLREGL